MRKRAAGSLTARDFGPVVKRLARANAALARAFPGDTGDRQPVHTVYGGAHLFKADTAPRLGTLALAAFDEYAPDGETLARVLALPDGVDPVAVRNRVVAKLRREPVEDFRIDFEDGYGNRPDEEEDGHAEAAAVEVADGARNGTLPPFIGIRIKPMSKELHRRSLRTLDIFVSTLSAATRRTLPGNFVITVPKVMAPDQVAAVAATGMMLVAPSESLTPLCASATCIMCLAKSQTGWRMCCHEAVMPHSAV